VAARRAEMKKRVVASFPQLLAMRDLSHLLKHNL